MPEQLLAPKTLCSLLQKSCNNLDISACRTLHHYIIKQGYLADAFLPNYLIRLYAVCGWLLDARNVFDRIVNPNVFSWSAIIAAYAKHGLHEQAFGLYTELQRSKVQPDGHVFVAVLTACVWEVHLDHGKLVHAHILTSPYKLDSYVNNTLIDMYANCGSLRDAQQVFDELPSQDIVSWNTLIAGYVQHKGWQDALLLFEKMQHTDLQPNQITFVCVFKACAGMRALTYGLLCHSFTIEHGLELVTRVSNVLIDMYAKCGSLWDAEVLFIKSSKEDVVTWTSMIAGYVDHGFGEKAIKGYEVMQEKCIKPNAITFASILKACSSLAAFDLGRLIHANIIERGLMLSIIIHNALIGMYANCGSFHDAMRLFQQSPQRDVVTWNSIIAGCTAHGHAHTALYLYKQLQQEGVQPDSLTLASTVRACSCLLNLREAKVIHVHVIESDLHQTACINNNVIHMYASCSNIEEARRVFDCMPNYDVVSWNAMIGGYVQCGWGEEAFRLFDQMRHDTALSNPVTLVCMLKACSITLALDKGRLLHADILRSNFEVDAYVGSVLINFYAKCGSFDDAEKVFSGLQNKTLVPWSAMIAGYAQQNNYREALTCLKDMQQGGIEPDEIAYVSLLSACSHAGVLCQGDLWFQLMASGHGLAPSLKHYNCFADLLGRAGHLMQARTVLQDMPFHPNTSSWISLLSHCRTHCYMEPGNSLELSSSF